MHLRGAEPLTVRFVLCTAWLGDLAAQLTHPSGRYAGAMADGEGSGACWSAAFVGVAGVAGGFGGTLWNSVATTTGHWVLIWPACGLSLLALASLYLCFAMLGGWWPTRRLVSGETVLAVPTLIAGERHKRAPGEPLPEATGIAPPSSSPVPAMGGYVVVGDIPQQPAGSSRGLTCWPS